MLTCQWLVIARYQLDGCVSVKGKDAMWLNPGLVFSKSAIRIAAKMSVMYPNKLFSISKQLELMLRKGKGIEEV